METNHDDGPRCPIHDKLLICRSCFAKEIGAKGGSAGTAKQKRAHAKVAKNPSARKKRAAKMRQWWEDRHAEKDALRAATARAAVATWAEAVTEAAALELAARVLEPEPAASAPDPEPDQIASPGSEPLEVAAPEPLPEPPDAARPEPADEPAAPMQEQVPADRRSALSAALARRRG